MATSAQIHAPGSVALDAIGNIYVADVQNFRIRKVDLLTNIITTIAGVGAMGYNGDEIPANTAQFMPSHIIMDENDNIIIADYNARRIRKIDALGIIHTIAGKGTVGYSGDGGPATAAELNPSGIALDNIGNLYVSDPYANVVRKIDLTGKITTVAGNGDWIFSGDNIPATSAQIQPTCIVVDRSNNLYISDNFNKRVYKVNTDGILYSVAGNGIGTYAGDGGPATDASLDNNVGQLSVDSCGNLYISETSGRIRKVSFNPDCLPLKVKDIGSSKQSSISLHPNPTTNTITITANENLHTLSITNMLGQVVVSEQYSGGKEVVVDVSALPDGVYVVRVNDRWVERMVKE